jgi:hypothetical protein
MPLRAFIAALVLVVVSARAFAADVVGYSEAFDTLYRVDLTAQTAVEIGRATPVGTSRLTDIEGLTSSPSGVLYAVSVSPTLKTLLQINPGSGIATQIGVLSLAGADATTQITVGLAFTCDGRLWLSSTGGSLYSINPTTAGATLVGNLGVTVTGLAAKGNLLYGTGSQGNNNLYRIDLTSAATTLVGPYGAGASYINTASPAFDSSGTLYAILDYVPPPADNDPVADWSDLARIDSTSAGLANSGPITASGNSYNDLFQIGLKGLAFLPSACAAVQASPTQLPVVSWPGIALLVLLLVGVAGFQFSRRYPTL